MELNEANINNLLDELTEAAKKVRAKIPYSSTDAMTPMVFLIGPNGKPALLPGRWRNEEEKYRFMKAVSRTAQDMFCKAVVLISDVRWVDNTRAEKMFGLPPIAEIGVEEWGKLYRRELATRYKGYLGNAPAELYSEAVIVVMKGPRLKGIPTRIAHYEKGENDSIRWLEMKNIYETTAQFNLLPDWWC